MWTILKLLGGYSQIIGGYIHPIPPRVSAPLEVANGKISVVSFTSW